MLGSMCLVVATLDWFPPPITWRLLASFHRISSACAQFDFLFLELMFTLALVLGLLQIRAGGEAQPPSCGDRMRLPQQMELGPGL